MSIPQGFLTHLPIRTPTLIVDEARARRNIERMVTKAQEAGVRLRAHAKTHQSAAVAEWFRDGSIDALTVSSVDMAIGFADVGWDDLTIAFPLNVRQIEEVDELAARIKLGILVDSPAAVRALKHSLSNRLNVWIKVDVGYGRAGLPWDQGRKIANLAEEIAAANRLNFIGLLTHGGHSYDAGSRDGILQVHRQSIERMNAAKRAVLGASVARCEISIGDTPACTVADDFEGVEEIRPGNFVYFDAIQWRAGICPGGDIAAAVACPVVGIYQERGQAVVYGGGVHFSKDTVRAADGKAVHGFLVLPSEQSWSEPRHDAPLVSVSQEHGILSLPEELLKDVEIGDLALIVPAHSCLAADLLGQGLTTEGTRLDRIAATAR